MKKILGLILILCMAFTTAWPMQLLPNGTIIDLGTNETINGTSVDFILFNDTLYIIPKVEINLANVTNYITNVTNISYGNFTNYTTQNITWENYTNCNFTYLYNGTGNFTYNKTEVDTKFGNYVLTSTGNSYASKNQLSSYALQTDLSTYALKTELSAATPSGNKVGSTTFWVMWSLIFVIVIVIAMMLFFNRE